LWSEAGHWDSVIHNYRETLLRPSDGSVMAAVMARMRDAVQTHTSHQSLEVGHHAVGWSCAAQMCEVQLMPELHVLDLRADGWIDGHVDSVAVSRGSRACACFRAEGRC
jgi:hypothetical protein